MGPDTRKPVIGEGGGVARNKGADQPAHPHSLTNAFVIPLLLKKIISRPATSEVYTF